MTFTLKELADGFESDGLILDDTISSSTIVDLTSGGVQQKGGEPPMLCLDQDQALRFWRMCAAEYVDGQPYGTRFKWIEKPVLDSWQITMADRNMTHRVVSKRYTVFARIAVVPPLP